MASRKRPVTDKEYKYIFSKVPRLCVDIILKGKAGVLLVNRSVAPEPNKWHIIGGTVHRGEKLEQSVKRIDREELGIKVDIKKFLGVIEYNFKKYFDFPVALAYLVTTKDKKIILDQDASEYKFFKKVPSNTTPRQKEFLLKHKLCK